MKNVFILMGYICVTILLAQAAPVKIELPVETAVFKAVPGAGLANAQCLTCHSADYVAIQPPMPAKFWKAEVDKMAAKYGAPIPTNEVAALVVYLAQTYGTEVADARPAPVAVKEIQLTDAKQMMVKYGCLNCHNPRVKIIGPSFQEVAAKYHNDPEATAKIVHQIENGGSGLWGTVPMPPYNQLSEAEVKLLAHSILAPEASSPQQP